MFFSSLFTQEKVTFQCIKRAEAHTLSLCINLKLMENHYIAFKESHDTLKQ